MEGDFDLADLKRRMQGAVNVLRTEFSGLRTGRASINILDPVMVEAYGSPMPLNQVATITVPEARMIGVNVWDRSLIGAVDKAIREADLGLNPVVDGQNLRIPIPELNAERRQEIVKLAHKYAEQARVAVRHVRRDGMEHLKRLEKDHTISQDEHRQYSDDVQKLTDGFVAEIDEALATKEKEVLQV
ncbi:ribosome recycling factor [Microbaculum marinum]|uniref:Ribosome-recycling factor n=1 Tax=Microbaculum marinum TaxID=1764581 RepID=A0AAW9RM18_9HYPH